MYGPRLFHLGIAPGMNLLLFLYYTLCLLRVEASERDLCREVFIRATSNMADVARALLHNRIWEDLA